MLTLLISAGPQQVAVPSVKGQSEAAATSAIQAKGLDVNVTPKTVSSGDPNVGRVIDQDPAGGTTVDPEPTVTITVGVAAHHPDLDHLHDHRTVSAGPSSRSVRYRTDRPRTHVDRGRRRPCSPR